VSEPIVPSDGTRGWAKEIRWPIKAGIMTAGMDQ
jgi:hypothetical protein